jgi:hypothetical protein
MAIKSEKDIYNVLEKYLRAAAYPMTVNMLMDLEEVRTTAVEEFSPGEGDERKATDKLSDTLGFMWRRGLLTRFPAPKESNSFARFSYSWDQKVDSRPVQETPVARAAAGKVGFTITEIDDGVLLEFQKFSVMIKSKT